MNPKTVIIGIGNTLRNDDGVGPYILDKLREKNLPKDIRLVNLESATVDILNAIEGFSKVIIIDSMNFQSKVGKIHEFKLDDLADNKKSFNLHNIDFKSLFLTAKKINRSPDELKFYCIEIKDTNYEQKLSAEVKKSGDILIKMLLDEVSK